MLSANNRVSNNHMSIQVCACIFVMLFRQKTGNQFRVNLITNMTSR